jgi:glycosyltransferase involved in cell wall biosynthesis
MKTPIRVLHFVDSLHIGGAERQFVQLAERLREPEFDLRVACYHADGELLGDLRALGIEPFELPLRSLRSADAARRLRELARYLRRERIDVLHATTPYPILLGVAAARLARTPAIVASVRDMGTLWSPGIRRAQRWACRFAHAVVANAEAVAARLRAEGYDGRRLEVILNGVAPPAPARAGEPLRRAFGWPADAPLIGAIGRLHPVKRFEDFVDAAARVAERHRSARFLIVGPTAGTPAVEAYAAALRRRVAERGLEGRFVLAGARRDVPALLPELALSVSSSASEGLSNTLIESLAAGVPVVATAVGGNPEVVEDGVHGRLVEPGDPEALARAICAVLESPELAARYARAGRVRASRRFGRERMVARTTELYERLLATAGRRATPPARGQGRRRPVG